MAKSAKATRAPLIGSPPCFAHRYVKKCQRIFGGWWLRKSAVVFTSPGMPPLEQYWEDGPQFSGWGTVVAKYPEGSPAVAQGTCGNGWVILTGIHAEAPAGWRSGMVFKTSAGNDNAYAAMLIRAAFNRVMLPHY